MRMVKAAVGSVLLMAACGSEGGPETDAVAGGQAPPANVVRADFDEAYLSGRLGGVTVAGEATVTVEQYDDGCVDCQFSYAEVRTARADGSWGMTILSIEGTLAELASGDATVYVTGCSGPDPDVMDWDVSTDDVDTETQTDPEDPNSTIVSIESTFSNDGYSEPREQESWWTNGAEPQARGDRVTTLLRIAR